MLIENAREQLQISRIQPLANTVVVGLAEVNRALRLFEEGCLSSKQLQEWADILEMNDHVEYQSGSEDNVATSPCRLHLARCDQRLEREAFG